MLLQQSPLSGTKLPPKTFVQGCFSSPQGKSKRPLCLTSAKHSQPCVQGCLRSKTRRVTDDNEAIQLFLRIGKWKMLSLLPSLWKATAAHSEGRNIGRASMYCKCTPWSSWRVWLTGRGNMDRPLEINVSCRINSAKAKWINLQKPR